MDQKLFNYITENQAMWCKIRENQKNIDRLAKSKYYTNRVKAKKLLLLQTAQEKS